MKSFAATLLLACGALAAHGQTPAPFTITLTPSTAFEIAFGTPLTLHASVSGPCSAGLDGTAVSLIHHDSRILAKATIAGSSCVSGSVSNAEVDLSSAAMHRLEIGSHFLTATIGASVSRPIAVTIAPEFRLPWPAGQIGAGISSSPLFSQCRTRRAQESIREQSIFPVPPPNLRTPYELTVFTSGDCAYGSTGAPLSTTRHHQWVSMQAPVEIPDEARIWVYDRFSSDTPSWHELPRACDDPACPTPPPATTQLAYVHGRSVTLQLVGNESAVVGAMAIAIPQRDARTDLLQDLWWSGPGENGWGLNLAKIGDRFFGTLFFYDTDGRAQWAVMPSGSWDPIHNVYSGALYIPKGSSYLNYEYLRFEPGQPVGTASLSFPTTDEGHFDYTINNTSGGKPLFRYVFGNRELAPVYGGMWWAGGRQDGWGVSVQHQGETAFVTWYTYLGDRRTTWFVMPAGRRTSANTFAGPLYRTSGAEWTGVPNYPGTRTNVTPVGTMELAFKDTDHGTMTTVVDGVQMVQPIERFGF